jgi:hypothetical protein
MANDSQITYLEEYALLKKGVFFSMLHKADILVAERALSKGV